MKIDKEKCGVCFGCAAVCPFDALRATESEIIIDNDKCTNCGICKKICPVGAITIED
ncbi:MAG: 4Fe-4S binding protein [Candidatus Odinarchaeia archaeon]